jgi:hypothetical protein
VSASALSLRRCRIPSVHSPLAPRRAGTTRTGRRAGGPPPRTRPRGPGTVARQGRTGRRLAGRAGVAERERLAVDEGVAVREGVHVHPDVRYRWRIRPRWASPCFATGEAEPSSAQAETGGRIRQQYHVLRVGRVPDPRRDVQVRPQVRHAVGVAGAACEHVLLDHGVAGDAEHRRVDRGARARAHRLRRVRRGRRVAPAPRRSPGGWYRLRRRGGRVGQGRLASTGPRAPGPGPTRPGGGEPRRQAP